METVFENQEKRILEHLKKGYSITSLEAMKEFNCLRLSDRIFRLRKKHFPINKKMIKEGRKSYAMYYLAE